MRSNASPQLTLSAVLGIGVASALACGSQEQSSSGRPTEASAADSVVIRDDAMRRVGARL
jgi:hypothetical protein